MNGVTFGNIHSYNDLNLVLSPFTPTPAEPKTNYIEVPGRNGYLDLTEALGEVKFNSRKFEFTFTIAPDDTLTFDERLSVVSNALNGVLCNITLDRDPDYYWHGRCTVESYRRDKNIGEIIITAIVDPYKLKQDKTEKTFVLTSTAQTVTITNGRMPAVPTIYCSAGGDTVTFNGTTHNLVSGNNRITAIRFVEGNNDIGISGSGTIKFTWQEGEL